MQIVRAKYLVLQPETGKMLQLRAVFQLEGRLVCQFSNFSASFPPQVDGCESLQVGLKQSQGEPQRQWESGLVGMKDQAEAWASGN